MTKRPTPSDLDTWKLVAKSVKPLRKQQRASAESAKLASPASPPVSSSSHKKTSLAPVSSGATLSSFVAPPVHPPVSQQLDPHLARQIKKQKLTVQARLDLHGYTQAEAYPAVQNFILRAADQRLRHVLIITGKGKAQVEGRRGILQTRVPQWLMMPPLQGLIVSFTSAPLTLGGDGALFVHVRVKK